MTSLDEQQILQTVIAHYVSPGSEPLVRELGAGNINATYLVTAERQSFVLQRINRQVFPDPIAIVENFLVVSRHLVEEAAAQSSDYRFARPLPTRQGMAWCQDETGEIWRAQDYLPGQPLAGIGDENQAAEIGRALGCFHALIGDLAIEQLQEPLPGFHILPRYLQEFDSLVGRSQPAKEAGLQSCLATVERYRPVAARLELAREQGLLATRIIHGDPKVDNFLFDAGQRRVISLIDLDTVGPGLLHYDLGDCLRSCCNRGGEDGDSRQVRFDMATCRSLLAAYGQVMGGALTRLDREYLYDAVLLISFELGLRFLTDHLRGNSYFKVRRGGENLQRAQVQFALVERIAELEAEIRSLL